MQTRSCCLYILHDTPGMALHTPLFVVFKKGKVASAIMLGIRPRFMQEGQKVTRRFPSISVKFQDIFSHASESFQCSRLSRYGKLNP